MKNQNANFLQVGQTIECGRCHPEKFEDCVSLKAKHGWKCDCKCHDKPQECKHLEYTMLGGIDPICADCKVPIPPQEDSMEIPWNKIEKTDTCWNWTGYLTPKGYGKLSVKSKQHKGGYRHQPAHRLVYELLVGKIPEGLQIDHLCKNTRCVNPEHLEPVTQKENIRRSDNFAGKNFRKTHCVKGHPFSGNNLAISSSKKSEGKRICRICTRERVSKHYYKIHKINK